MAAAAPSITCCHTVALGKEQEHCGWQFLLHASQDENYVSLAGPGLLV
jgi:hypothetical protein